jgi:glutaconyl-CoA decarboxylase
MGGDHRFDNKVFAGAWLPGQYENVLRCTDLSKRLNIPLVWLVNCSGVKLPSRKNFMPTAADRRDHLFQTCRTQQMGIPILAGIYGTNPAGGGYQGISPTILFAHKNCNIAVGGGGILSGMSPKGYFDLEGAEQLIDAAKQFKVEPPGRWRFITTKPAFSDMFSKTEEAVA